MSAGEAMSQDNEAYLESSEYVDSNDPDIQAFAKKHAQGADAREIAVSLYYAARDEVSYDAYQVGVDPRFYRASDCLREGKGFCIPKAALLAAVSRAAGIPARVGFADVRNHLSTPRLDALVGSNIYRWHSYTEQLINGRWVKSTPAFDSKLCEALGVHTLEFDGREDSLFQEFNVAGHKHMEYVTDRGQFADVPYAQIVETFRNKCPRWLFNLDERDAT
jgi:transglutaminase-like putative cysteine protease